MSENSETHTNWKQITEDLSVAPNETWDPAPENAKRVVAERRKSITPFAIDDEERHQLLAAEAQVFQARVKQLGYGAATHGFSGPARASEQTLEAGLTTPDGHDIENPT